MEGCARGLRQQALLGEEGTIRTAMSPYGTVQEVKRHNLTKPGMEHILINRVSVKLVKEEKEETVKKVVKEKKAVKVEKVVDVVKAEKGVKEDKAEKVMKAMKA